VRWLLAGLCSLLACVCVALLVVYQCREVVRLEILRQRLGVADGI